MKKKKIAALQAPNPEPIFFRNHSDILFVFMLCFNPLSLACECHLKRHSFSKTTVAVNVADNDSLGCTTTLIQKFPTANPKSCNLI